MIHNLIIQLVVIDVMLEKCLDVVYAFLSFLQTVWMIDGTEEENNSIGLMCRNFEIGGDGLTRRTSVDVSEVRTFTYLC